MAEIEDLFAQAKSRVFTIEPHRDFLGDLARVILRQANEGQFDLSDAVILLPTRRAARSLEMAFARVSENRALILPRIRTLGDLEPYDVNLCEFDETMDMPEAISPLARKFALAKFIAMRDKAASWRNNTLSALAAADALGELLDAGELNAEGPENADWSKIDNLVEDHDLAEHWQKSCEFLKIITENWPEYLRSNRLIEGSYKRRRAIELLAQNWQQNPPNHMVIIAGSTGAIKATRILMKTVIGLPKGLVVLPGLDLGMDDKTWQKINKEDGSPQRALYDTINFLELERKNIGLWPNFGSVSQNLSNRRAILNEALTPKEATADWLARIKELKINSQNLRSALDGFSLIEAQNEDEEAHAIALIMRQTLETEDETCALVTPNLDIARRVCSKMTKWDIKLDISSGVPANNTIIGNLFSLTAKWLEDVANPNYLMALLSHPMANFGLEWASLKRGAAALEIALLRQSRKDETLNDLFKRAKSLPEKTWKYARADKDSAMLLIETLCSFSENFKLETREYTIEEVAEILISACEKIAIGHDLWKGETGKSLANFFNELRDAAPILGRVNLADGFEVILYLISQVTIRPNSSGAHPRLAVLGPLEARLLHFDKLILAGLDEGIWPAGSKIDPFLSRPMRKALGLSSHDLRIGLSAHDFAGFASNQKVVLTRSMVRAGSPAVTSRWLWRLKTLCSGVDANVAKEILANSQILEIIKSAAPKKKFDVTLAIPSPRPPSVARPNRFSATQIETWIRDPYKTYVQKILDLTPLDPLGGEVSAKERGSAIHKALEVIEKWHENPTLDYSNNLREACAKELSNIGFKGYYLERELLRLEPTIALIVENEKQRIKDGWSPKIEIKNESVFQTSLGNITLHAKSDRIDYNPNGEIEIWDYKTGSPPTNKQIAALISPQLPVTALIIDALESDAGSQRIVSGFGHVRVGNSKPSIVRWQKKNTKYAEIDGDESEIINRNFIGDTKHTITKLFENFANQSMPYLSKPRVSFSPKVNYEDLVDRLARRGEWASIGETGEGDDD